jgi:hypothetical protein
MSGDCHFPDTPLPVILKEARLVKKEAFEIGYTSFDSQNVEFYFAVW